MHAATVLIATYAFAEVGLAFQLPFGFHLPWVDARLNNQQLPLALSAEHEEPELSSNRIAIIGAGAGGSSAAFWLSQAKERWGLDVEIDVFEERDYVGGRSTTVQPYNDSRLAPIELGASIFVKANKNLWRASQEFGLNLTDFSGEDGDGSLGIWDGKEFLLTTKSGWFGSWWSTVKVLWRYGINAPRRTQALVKEMINTYLSLYTAPYGNSPWQDVSHLVSSFDWASLLNTTTAEYLDGQGVNPKFTREMVEAATRVNYGQNADTIHALEGFTSMAAEGAVQVIGGNWQIFDQFIKRSNATLFLGSRVTAITQKSSDKYVLHYTSSTNQPTARSYRAVILAAPFHSASLKLSLLDSTSLPVIPPQPYVHLHVTLLSTPNPAARTRYFGLKEKDVVPPTVLTTWERARASGGDEKPEFNSLSYHGKVQSTEGEKNLTKLEVGDPRGRGEAGEEWSVKVFSERRLEDAWLRRTFGRIGWVYRKEWDAYPVLPPTETFPPVKLAKGLYYVNSFEPFISTMETETISSRNVVELLLQEEYQASICKTIVDPNANITTIEEPEDFVYGFDC